MKIRILKKEYELIKEVLTDETEYFTATSIKNSEMILKFNNLEKAIEFDELIKDKLVYQGFDIHYNTNQFGKMCENIIDKMYLILE